MANGISPSLHESASFWNVASGVLGVLGIALVGTTAGKVGKTNVNPAVLALFALGCLVILAAVCCFFWGMVLFVAGRRPPLPPSGPGKPVRPSSPSPAAPAATPPVAAVDSEPRKGSKKEPKIPQSGGHDELGGVSADDLIKIRKENTEIRAQTLLLPYVGKWLTVTADLTELASTFPSIYGGNSYVADLRNGGRWQAKAFFQKEWQDRLSTIPVGSKITVRGKVESVSDHTGVVLYSCELQ